MELRRLLLPCVLIVCSAVRTNAETEKSTSDRIAAVLARAPFWVLIGGDETESQLSKLDETCKAIKQHSNSDVRRGLLVFLNRNTKDDIETALRIDNARILCGYLFVLPKNHAYDKYFERDSSGVVRLRRAGSMAMFNYGRFSTKDDIVRFMRDYDEMAEKLNRQK